MTNNPSPQMDILSRLQSEFGEAVSSRAADEDDAVDGVQPQAIAAPRDEEAAQALIHFCGRENVAFVPRGGGTKMHIGAPPSRCDLIISTENLTQIFDHDEGNATVQAGAGISLKALDVEMRKHGQFVPLEGEKAATLGGTIATNYFGGSKLKYGAPRDLVTGLHAVLSDGRLVKAGSKVVKNVSGYDLNKLFIGSFGNLGLITEVTVRLRPQVQRDCWSQVYDDRPDVEAQVREIVDGPFEPTWLRVEKNRKCWILTTWFEGGETAINGQVSLLPESEGNSMLFGPLTKFDWEVRVHLSLQNGLSWHEAAWEQGALQVHWYPHLGVLRASFADTPDIAALRADAEKLGGFLVVERAPIEIKTPELVWGKPRGDFALMRKLKQSFDAANVCAPGRFIGGL